MVSEGRPGCAVMSADIRDRDEEILYLWDGAHSPLARQMLTACLAKAIELRQMLVATMAGYSEGSCPHEALEWLDGAIPYLEQDPMTEDHIQYMSENDETGVPRWKNWRRSCEERRRELSQEGTPEELRKPPLRLIVDNTPEVQP